jgi:hypothetical protein
VDGAGWAAGASTCGAGGAWDGASCEYVHQNGAVVGAWGAWGAGRVLGGGRHPEVTLEVGGGNEVGGGADVGAAEGKGGPTRGGDALATCTCVSGAATIFRGTSGADGAGCRRVRMKTTSVPVSTAKSATIPSKLYRRAPEEVAPLSRARAIIPPRVLEGENP